MAKLRLMKQLMNDKGFNSRVESALDSAKQTGWVYYFKQYPVPQELKVFMESLEQALPNMTFFPAEISRAVKNGLQTCSIIDEFSVCMDGSPFDLGRVGFKDYAVGRNNKDCQYGVYSRRINNAKYASGRDQFHMVMSNDVNKAVKNACKYIVPFTHKELATAFYQDFQGKTTHSLDNAKQKMYSIINSVRESRDALIAEILHLKSTGVQFKTEAFIKAAEEIGDAVLLAEEERKRDVKGLFVRINKVGEDVYVDVQEVQDIRNREYKPDFSSQPTTYAIENLDPELAGNISVLNILEDGQYVARVGQKIDENTFWIERG